MVQYLARTRASRVTIVISAGGSPSTSAVARCTASSMRTGSTGNGRRVRCNTASLMVNDVTAAFEALQRTNRHAFTLWFQTPRPSRPQDGA